MPKMKTHSGAKKRFAVTGTGKLRARRANRYHLAEHKPSKRMRRLADETQVSPADRKIAERLLGRR
jgi:large subunit ribosomal protein L35